MGGERSALTNLRLLLSLVAGLLLSGCTFFFDAQDSVQPDPAPDSSQRKTVFAEVDRITQSLKLAGVSEVSDIGPNEAQSGPENWTVCSRTGAAPDQRYLTFFVKGDKVVTWRQAVINDRCETRRFSSFGQAR